jgi:hypothetical protein
MRNMPWEDSVWDALKAALSVVPPFVRKKALTKIIEGAEENARARGAEKVEEPDLVKAASEKVPENMRDVCLDILAEQGIRTSAKEK